MAEGHCLIVPMNHVTQSTVTDEDVWAEIQVMAILLLLIGINKNIFLL